MPAHRGAPDVTHAEVLLERLDGVKPAGRGWRARCPACGGPSRKLSIAEDGARVLVYCFAGCSGNDIISSVGLQWADLMPPRNWPESPEERSKARRAIREAGWSAAISVLALESKIALIAARHVAGGQCLAAADEARLADAVKRIDHASVVLVEARHG